MPPALVRHVIDRNKSIMTDKNIIFQEDVVSENVNILFDVLIE